MVIKNQWMILSFLLVVITCSVSINAEDRWKRQAEGTSVNGQVKSCGVSAKILANIKTAQKSEIKDWPWIAGIIRADDKFHFCGGVILSETRILTAAHCIHGVHCSKILVRIGEYDFTRQDDSIYKDYKVAAIIEHQDYDSGTYEHDIAMLILKTPIKYNIYAQPICLPPPGPSFENRTCIVSGWGTLGYGAPKSDILMEVPVPIWQHSKCVKAYTQTIFSTNLCAAAFEGGRDSCQGDSGGPLMCQQEDKKWMTVGVVSWGIKCAVKGKPGIYTKVNEYLGWIDNIVNTNKLYTCVSDTMSFPK